MIERSSIRGGANFEDVINFDSWHWVDITRDGMTGFPPVPYIKSQRRLKILKWCHKYCEKHWSEAGILHYVFEDEEDSVLFALTWC